MVHFHILSFLSSEEKDIEMTTKHDRSTFKDTCGPSGLHLRDRHYGSQWLNKANDGQCGAFQLRRKNVLVKFCFVLRHWDHFWGQERIGKIVTCGKNLQDRGTTSHTQVVRNSFTVQRDEQPTTRSTSSTMVPSLNSTLDPWSLRMLGFTWMVPDRMRLGRSSLTVGCWLNNLKYKVIFLLTICYASVLHLVFYR